MRRVVGLSADELERRERAFDGLVTRSIRSALRAVTAGVSGILTAAADESNTTIPAGALGVVSTTWNTHVDETLFPYVVQTFVDAAADVYDELPDVFGVDVPEVTYELAQTYLTNARNRLVGIGDVVWADMRAQLAIGYEAGESIEQLATRLRKVAQVSEPRALTIARTEVVPAANFGSLLQVKAAGFSDEECRKEWLATTDARTREAHRAADGQRVGLSQPFRVGGDFLQVPGDPLGRADNVINCRCTVAYVFDDDDDDDHDGPLTADAAFEKLHPRAPDGKFGTKSPFNIVPKSRRGKSGDRMYAPGMWGRYGGAGIMMRHVDENGVARYMVVQRATGGYNKWRWQLPGGARDELETAEQAAAREANEEIGVTPEQLETLTPRGAHVVQLPVEGKAPWTYSSVVADAPEAFKPKIDYEELGAARWLTYDQLVEMRGRGRLIAPFAAQLEDIIARFDDPLVADGFSVTIVSRSDDYVGYYDLMVAAKDWDEAKHKRDSDGKFTKKVGVPSLKGPTLGKTVKSKQKPIHINTAVIYKTKFADKAVVAEKPGTDETEGVPQRLVWSENLKKFVLQAGLEDGTWINVESYGKGAAYQKFSKETGWLTPATDVSAPATPSLNVPTPAPALPTGLKVSDVDSMGAAEFVDWFNKHFFYNDKGKVEWDGLSDEGKTKIYAKAEYAANAGQGAAPLYQLQAWGYKKAVPKKAAAPTVKPAATPSSVPALGKPIHINTAVIYKTKFDDGAVVAEKFAADDDGLRLVWNAKKKKFILQGQNPNGTWYDTGNEYNKSQAYQKFSKQTGWTHPITAPAASIPPKPKSKHIDDMNETELLQWVDDNADVISNMESWPVGNISKVLDKNPAFQKKFFDAFFGENAAGSIPDFDKITSATSAAWINNLTIDDWKSYTPDQRAYINDAFNTISQNGEFTAEQIAKFQKLNGTGRVIMPDFENDTPKYVASWFESLTQDDFDSLSTSDQIILQEEAKFYDVFGSAGTNFSDKIKNFIAGKGDSNVVAKTSATAGGIPDFEAQDASIDEVSDWFDAFTQEQYDALSKEDKVKLFEMAAHYDQFDYTGGIKQKMTKLIVTFTTNSAAKPQVKYDFDDTSGPGGMSPLYVDGDAVGWVGSFDDGSGAYIYSDASPPKYLGSANFDENETVEETVGALIKSGAIASTSKPSAPSTPAAVTTPSAPSGPPASTLKPGASLYHVEVHSKIKHVSAVGVPDPGAAPHIYSVITPAQAQKFQESTGKKWTTAELNAVKRYGTSVGYRSTNAVLRDDKKQLNLFNDAQLKAGVKNAVDLQSAMAPLPANVKLFRGTGAHAFGQNSISANFDELKKLEGSTLTDEGFISTTVDEKKAVSYDYAKKPIQMIINAPAGSPAVYADAGIPGHNEHEIILGAGTSYRIDQVRKATPADQAKYGSHVQHVVEATVVPSSSSSAAPINAPSVPTPAVAPTTLTPGAPGNPVNSPTHVTDLKKPMKMTTTVVYKNTYAHGQVVAYHKNANGSLSRLVWSETNKKFISQNYDPIAEKWVAYAGYGKGETYNLGKLTPNDWYAPPPGDSAIGTGGLFGTSSVTPSVSKSAPTGPSHSSVPTPKPVKQGKFDATTIQAMHGQIPPFSTTYRRELFDNFRKNSSHGPIALSTDSSITFSALKETLDKHNNSPGVSKLNMLQLLKLVDEEATNRANAIAVAKGEPGNIVNANLYEKKLIAWLQTSSGASFATDLIHPPPPLTVNGHTYKSKYTTEAQQLLAQVKTPSSIGVSDTTVTHFSPITPASAQVMQNNMLSSEPWTAAQKAALTKYSGSYYGTLNPFLRDKASTVNYMSAADQLTAARTAVELQKAMRPLTKSIIVNRKTGTSQFPGLTDSAGYDDVKKFEGQLFIDRAPLSTSVSTGVWSGKVVMEIEVPAGTPAAYIKSVSQNKGEDELLLAQGLKYRVISVKKSGTGYSESIQVRLRVEP